MNKIVALLFLLNSVVFSQPTLAQSTDRVIGVNNLVLVKSDLSNIPPRFKKLVPAIGKLSSGCTVTHIGQGYAITAGHCFWQTFFDEDLKKNQACSDETVTWQWTEGSANNKVSKCLEIIAMQKSDVGNLDFGIIKVSEPPTEFIDIEWNKKPKEGSFVTIFSYPAEDPLSWSKYCRTKKISVDSMMPFLMHHLCDTQAGSSGAAVLDILSGKIVALHKSGDGEILPDGTMTPAVENYATYIMQSPIKNILIKSGYVIK